MALPVSVHELKSGLYGVFWNTKSSSVGPTNRGGYYSNTSSSSSINYSSKMDLTILGVDECYNIECSMKKTISKKRRTGETSTTFKPSLKLMLETCDEDIDNFRRRKVTARFLGYEKEMIFTSSLIEDSKEVALHRRKVDSNFQRLHWTAEWTELTQVGCSSYGRTQDLAETFEILIDMDPTNSLVQGQQNVLNHIANLWDSKNRADVTFRCQNKDIKAHVCIVSSGSPILDAMLKNDFEEKQERITIIRETKADVFEKLLHFIYTGKLDTKFPDIAALLAAADTYFVASLKEECEKYLSRSVTVGNATAYLILSYLHNAKKLRIAVLNYMQQNSEAICARQDWKKLLNEYSDLGFEAVQFMVKKNVYQESKEDVKQKQSTNEHYYDDDEHLEEDYVIKRYIEY